MQEQGGALKNKRSNCGGYNIIVLFIIMASLLDQQECRSERKSKSFRSRYRKQYYNLFDFFHCF